MYHKSCYLNKRRLRCNGKHPLTLCKSAGIDGHKFSGKDPAEENTSNASTGNPKKDDSTIPEESILKIPSYYNQQLWTIETQLWQVRKVAKHASYLAVDHSALLSLKI